MTENTLLVILLSLLVGFGIGPLLAILLLELKDKRRGY
jgi:ABC-type polysaccharide transport system permease subunit